MKLSSLHLEHFRNYTRLDFVFPQEPIVVLSGENAQGKTNFLEAIYMMALTKSFRVSDREFLKQFEESYYRIEAKGEGSSGDDLHLELAELHEPKNMRVLKKNGVKISAPKFIGNLKVVLFRPEDLQMLTDEPAGRRKYLNTILIQTVPGYMKQLQTYQKLLTQRNALLLQIKQQKMSGSASSTGSLLDLFDEQLAEAGSALLTSRLELVEFLKSQLQIEGSPYTIDYLSSIFYDVDLCPGKEWNRDINNEYGNSDQLQARARNDLQSYFQEALTAARPRDLRSTHTSVGPHRDDLKLKINHQPLELTASRGELRSALMELKKAEIAWITTKTQDTPLILLDDIFSELDSNRKNDLFDLLPHDAQIIMTIAEGNPLPTSLTTHPKLRSASTVRKIHAGQIHL